MLSLLKNTLLRRSILFRPAFYFSDFSSQLIERHKAILASQIIQIIKNSPLNEYRSDSPCPSLRQKILDQIENYKIDTIKESEQQKVTSAVKHALRKYFVNGVWVPYDMCGQTIFQEKSLQYQDVKDLNEEVEIRVDQENQKDLFSLQFRKLQFCPTYFVTGQIFRHIFQGSDHLLLTGQYGVGKTYSFILYTLLSEIIFRYRHKYHSNKSMKELPSQIISKIPKAFYWSVNKKSEHHDPIIFNNLIKRQFYELQNTDYSGNILDTKPFKNIAILLQAHFKIRIILLMDQISQLASALRQYDLAQQKEKNKPSNQKTKKKSKAKKTDEQKEQQRREGQAQTEVQENYNSYLSYRKILQKILRKRHFHRTIYLSSVDIERHLLSRLQLMGPTNHGKIEDFTERISYPTKLYGDVSVSDTAEFIVFNLKIKWQQQLERKLNLKELDLLKTIKNELLKNFRKQQFFFVLPLSVNKIIGTSSQLMYQNVQKNVDQLEGYIMKQMIKIQEQSVTQMKTKLKEFFEKKLPTTMQDNLKYILLAQLWNKSVKIQEEIYQYQNADDKSEEEKANKIFQQLPKLQIELKNDVSINMAPVMPHNLFGFDGDKLYCFVNPTILSRVIESQKQTIYQGLLDCSDDILQHALGTPTSQGAVFESALITILLKGKTSILINQSQKPKMQIQIKTIPPKAAGFIPIPKDNSSRHKEFCFLDSFIKNVSELLGQKIKNKQFFQQSLLLFPVKKNWVNRLSQILKLGIFDKENQYDKYSKLVDFAICRYRTFKQKATLDVNAFDPTIAKGTTPEGKVKDFFWELASFKDHYDNININDKNVQVTLNYIVISSKNLDGFNCKNQLVKKISQFQQDVKKIKQQQTQKLQEAQRILKNLKEFKLEDCGNLCKVTMNKNHKSGQPVINTIGIVNFYDHIVLKCQEESNVSKEMAIMKKFEQIYKRIYKRIQV